MIFSVLLKHVGRQRVAGTKWTFSSQFFIFPFSFIVFFYFYSESKNIYVYIFPNAFDIFRVATFLQEEIKRRLNSSKGRDER